VNSSHHQAVARLAPGFRVSAVSPEDAVIEAFECAQPQSRPLLLAVQWHPEGMDDGLPLADGVLDAFLSAEH
jgi:putative glutamine amidotransferase